MSVEQTPESVVTSVADVSTQPTGTAQEQARAQVYSDYATLYATPPEAPAEPVTLAEPVVDTPAAASGPDLQTLFSEQQATIASLQAQLNELKPRPVEPVASIVKPHSMESWVQLMAEQKYDEANTYLIDLVTPAIQAKLQPQIVQQSVEATNAEREITQFITTFESANADILPLRDYVTMGAERRLTIAQNENKIKTTADFVREYKKAVTDEATALRTQFQLSRAAGKQDAMTTQREVLSVATMEPSGIQQPSAAKPTAMPTTFDYISQRKDRMASIQGLRQ